MQTYTITFIGTAEARRLGLQQVSFGPLWPRGLKRGESVTLHRIPHECMTGGPDQFLVNGQPYAAPRTKVVPKIEIPKSKTADKEQ